MYDDNEKKIAKKPLDYFPVLQTNPTNLLDNNQVWIWVIFHPFWRVFSRQKNTPKNRQLLKLAK